MVTSMFFFPALGTRHKAHQRTRLQLKQATYLAEVRAQREWERGGAGLDGEGVQTWKPGAKVHVGSQGRRGHGPKVGVGQLCNKGLRELLPARSGPASPGIPLSRALFTRYRFSCLFTGSY